MKTHLNFATTDLSKSVEFYSALLDSEPVKPLGDYALFITKYATTSCGGAAQR